MRRFKNSSVVNGPAWGVLLMSLMGPGAHAADGFMRVSISPRELAFARHIASYEDPDPLGKSGPVGIIVEASLPDLYKSALLCGVREQGKHGPNGLHILQIAGDGTAAEEVIGKYFNLRDSVDALTLPSVAITPDNYKFHFAREVNTGGAVAYIYEITPKKKRPGLITGQLWMDSGSGQEVLLTGGTPGITNSGDWVNVVRETKLVNGLAYARVTHLAFQVPHLGRAEVVVTEMILNPEIVLESPALGGAQ